MPENALAANWWLMLLRGILAILFAVLAFTNPGITLASLILVFGAFALFEGVLAIAYALRSRKERDDWWVPLLEGLFGVAFGIVTFLSPLVTTLVLLFYIAAWAIVAGALRVAAAIRLRKEIRGEGWLIVSGVISIAFGVLMMAFPGAGAIAALFYIGAWALLEGVALVFLSFSLRGHLKRFGEGAPPRAGAPAH